MAFQNSNEDIINPFPIEQNYDMELIFGKNLNEIIYSNSLDFNFILSQNHSVPNQLELDQLESKLEELLMLNNKNVPSQGQNQFSIAEEFLMKYSN
jgi:hypothetical protein